MIGCLAEDLNEHGEVHVVVEEHEHIAGDGYIGLRRGNTDFHDLLEVIRVDDGKTEHVIPYDRVVYYTIPTEFPD